MAKLCFHLQVIKCRPKEIRNPFIIHCVVSSQHLYALTPLISLIFKFFIKIN